jgi:uncharacterized protein (TIGR02594 family)
MAVSYPRRASDQYSPWMAQARGLIGLAEVPGHIHEARVLSLWARLGISVRDDETPWCAAFVGAMLEEVGLRSTRSGAARSYLKWGRDLYLSKRPLFRTLPLGCIVVLERPGSSWSGHVAFYAGTGASGYVDLLGGNQGNRVSVSRFPTSRVIGVRWPEHVPLPPLPGAYAGPLEATLPTNVPLSTGEA